jgi:hypothetical protein
MQAIKLTLIVAGACAGAMLGIASGKAEPSSSELLLQKLSAQQVALSRELSAVRVQLAQREHAWAAPVAVRAPGDESARPVQEVAPYDDEPQVQEPAPGPAEPAAKPLDAASLEAQQLGTRILDEASADGTWDQARALGFRAQLMRLGGPEHSALARSLMVRINRGEIVPEACLPGLF